MRGVEMAVLGHLAPDLPEPPHIRWGPDLDQQVAHLQLCTFDVGGPVEIWLPAWLAACTTWQCAVHAVMHTDTRMETCTQAVAELGWVWFRCINMVAGLMLVVLVVPGACCLGWVLAAISLGTMHPTACEH